MKSLSDSVQYLSGVGPQRFKLFQRLGVNVLYDLLYYLPRKYLDRTQIKSIAEITANIRGRFTASYTTGSKTASSINQDEEITVKGFITGAYLRRLKFRKTIFEIVLSDDTGRISAVWFNQPFLQDVLIKGTEVILSGKVKIFKQVQLSSPEYEIIPAADCEDYVPLHSQGIIPSYPLTGGLTQKFLRRTIKNSLADVLPLMSDAFIASNVMGASMSLAEALKQVHYPDSQEQLQKARQKLVYDELFLFHLSLGLRRHRIHKTQVKYPLKISAKLDERIRARIPFKLTNAQERVIREISNDLVKLSPMNRLLQGDVGSGKTIVAVYAILTAIGNGLQSAFMAPTEILAEQHHRTVSSLLEGSKVKIVYLSGALTAAEKKEAKEIISSGQASLVIGTHALIQKDVLFNKLGLLIIDEQHKFGVMQRADLRSKGENPHTLVMTATPIPRTLALSAFGDLDISTIDEMPPGRQAIKTVLRQPSKITDAFAFIREKIKEGRQVYFVYPLIQDLDEQDNVGQKELSRLAVPLQRDTAIYRQLYGMLPAEAGSRRAGKAEQLAYKTTLKSATTTAKYLKEQIFPGFNIALLHGEMPDKKKDKIMQGFRSGKINILVSTVVIEVGIDVPNASIMVIENAERYGLAQLHQLRGRIGRGAHQSYCLLFGEFTSPESEKRLRIMEETNDGFRIAEEDLRIRGPGEFLGVRQSGLPEFRVADLAIDFDALKATKADAERMLSKDLGLSLPQNRKWLERIKMHFRNLIVE